MTNDYSLLTVQYVVLNTVYDILCCCPRRPLGFRTSLATAFEFHRTALMIGFRNKPVPIIL